MLAGYNDQDRQEVSICKLEKRRRDLEIKEAEMRQIVQEKIRAIEEKEHEIAHKET